MSYIPCRYRFHKMQPRVDIFCFEDIVIFRLMLWEEYLSIHSTQLKFTIYSTTYSKELSKISSFFFKVAHHCIGFPSTCLATKMVALITPLQIKKEYYAKKQWFSPFRKPFIEGSKVEKMSFCRKLELKIPSNFILTDSKSDLIILIWVFYNY